MASRPGQTLPAPSRVRTGVRGRRRATQKLALDLVVCSPRRPRQLRAWRRNWSAKNGVPMQAYISSSNRKVLKLGRVTCPRRCGSPDLYTRPWASYHGDPAGTPVELAPRALHQIVEVLHADKGEEGVHRSLRVRRQSPAAHYHSALRKCGAAEYPLGVANPSLLWETIRCTLPANVVGQATILHLDRVLGRRNRPDRTVRDRERRSP